MAEEATGGETPTVKSIFVYPVKSCRGISVSEASLSSTVMRAPGMNVLKIPLVEPRAVANGVSIWDWHGSALDEGEEVATWFSDYLEKPSRLVRFNEASETRPVPLAHAVGHNIRFNDVYPFHLVSQKSLDALNDQLQEPIPVDRFRPNFLIDGCEPFSEDLWDEIEINGLTFREGELCYRCKVPTINQETAEVGSEPKATLRKFRNDKTLFPNKEKPQGRVYMGTLLVSTNYTPDKNGNKSIRVGDPIHVLKTFSSYADCRN
ncbi:mitochondrial amidoxime reducing component 2 [Phtheirospermum japonicum]|uniref:Mitochondrial amidoxime reducing component 2 n=1 Tax=Phtheirospermum japonicum TaxID=374723 RepID=A0A830CLX3_9LAMI|nr:mitochondrial amidoxime reducing component 2 [Phtheirospermum japonicum]